MRHSPATPSSGTVSPSSALVDTLAADIRSGKLAPGTVLPTHRKLAATHHVALATASRVYAQLKAVGLIVGETGRGTFVRDRPVQGEWDAGDEARLNRQAADLSFNHPGGDGQAELLRAMLRTLASSGDLTALMHQQPPGGRPHERDIVCRFLDGRGIHASRDRVLIVNGAQQGLDIAVRSLLKPGDRVAVDALTYPGFKMIAEARHIVLEPIAFHAHGPDFDALEHACLARKVRAIYVMPTIHNPLGWVLDARQRRRLVAIARRHDCLLIEDAAYAFLARKAPPPLVVSAPERTVYVSSLSKSVATGLRFGFMVVPEASAGRVKAQLRASLWSLPSLITAIGTRWMEDGTVDREEQQRRRDARVRQALARAILHGLELTAHPASLFVWLTLPAELRMDRIYAELARRNIAVSKAHAYATTAHVPHALRLGLSSLPLPELAAALQAVREVIETFPI